MSRRPAPVSTALQTSAGNVEVGAFLTRMRGLSSEGIVQALADLGWDSGHMAGEIARLYASTDEKYYQQKLLAMIVDLMKQKEGQRVHVDDMAGATDKELDGMQVELARQIQVALAGGQLESRQEAVAQLLGTGGSARPRLASPETVPAQEGGRRARPKKRRNAQDVRADAHPGEVPPK